MALPLYGAFTTETKCQLLGDLKGKRVLDICCGTGQSLAYVAKMGAEELWGLDIAAKQIELTKQHLLQNGLIAKLMCSPMEDECGIPTDYFDTIYSVYGIGWTTDLDVTFKRIASYLKKDGIFVFSWSHPIHKCVAYEGGNLTFRNCYFDESWYSIELDGACISLSDRKLSTYVNALVKAGLIIEELVEETETDIANAIDSQFAQKAKMLPVTFVLKAKKR